MWISAAGNVGVTKAQVLSLLPESECMIILQVDAQRGYALQHQGKNLTWIPFSQARGVLQAGHESQFVFSESELKQLDERVRSFAVLQQEGLYRVSAFE